MKKLKKFKEYIKSPKTNKKDDGYHEAFCGFITKGQKKSKKNINETWQENLPLKGASGYPPFPKYQVYPEPKENSKPHPDQGKLKFSSTKKHADVEKHSELRAKIKAENQHEDTLHRDLVNVAAKVKHPQHEKTALRHYTGEGYTNINKYLYTRGKKTNDFEKSDITHGYDEWTKNAAKEHFDGIKTTIKHISHALRRHKTDRDLVVHTGVSRSPERFINKDKPKDHIKMVMPAYTSTSIGIQTPRFFAQIDHEYDHNHLFIHTKKDEQGKLGTPTKVTRDEANKLGKYPDSYTHLISIHVPKGSHGMYVDGISKNQGEREFLLHKNAKFHIDPTPTYDHKNKVVNWHGTLAHDGIKWTGKEKK